MLYIGHHCWVFQVILLDSEVRSEREEGRGRSVVRDSKGVVDSWNRLVTDMLCFHVPGPCFTILS